MPVYIRYFPVIDHISFLPHAGSTLALISATMEMMSTELVLTCEAAGIPTPMIYWDARLSGSRMRLSPPSDNYEIIQDVDEDNTNIVRSILSYVPEDVDFIRPECFIENGVEMLRVQNADFQMVMVQTTAMTMGEMIGYNVSWLPKGWLS